MKRVFFIVWATVALLAGTVCFSSCTEKTTGEIKNLEEAYETGWITQEDLKSIAYYYNDKTEAIENNGDFVPVPKSPERLNDNTITAIRKTYREQYFEDKSTPLDTITVTDYCGTYNGCVVATVSTYCIAYDIIVQDEYEIGGVVFYNYFSLSVWNEKG